METPESIDLNFQKLWLSVKRRWLPAAIVFSCMLGLGTVVAIKLKPVYTVDGKLLIKKDRTSSLTGVAEDKEGGVNPLTLNSIPQKTESEIITSIPLAQKTITALKLKDKTGAPLKPTAFIKGLKLKNLPGTDILQITYQSNDAQEAVAAVNKLMSVYIESSKLNNRADAVIAGEFISKQLPQTEATVRQADAALRKFKEKNNVVDLQQEAKAAVGVITDLDKQITEVQARLKDVTAQSAELQNKLSMNSQQALAMSSVSQSSGVQNLLEELQKVQSDLAKDQTLFRDEAPVIAKEKEKEAALKALLKERLTQVVGKDKQLPSDNLQMGKNKEQLALDLTRVEQERLGLVGRLANLYKAQSDYKQRVNVIPKLEQEQRELERQLKASESTYESLLKKLQELKVAENQNIGNARIIELAEVPEKQEIKKKLLVVAGGVVLGILLGMATIILLEIRDTSLKTLQDARELFEYTLLGVIPSFSKKAARRRKNLEWIVPELPVRDLPQSPISEAYRMLQANLKFLSSDKPLKVIVVTSSVPQEGKSTTSANLATAIAQVGRRVLLIDADLRHPVQHHIWDLTNAAGLSDIIVGQAEFQTVVSAPTPNLDVLSSGVVPPNPIALLDSKRMASMIEDFASTYDFVIIDAPPLVLGADALTLGNMTDGVLLVVRPGEVDVAGARAAKELLERSGQNVLGMVVNGLVLEKESDSYFHYLNGYSNQGEATNRKKSRLSIG